MSTRITRKTSYFKCVVYVKLKAQLEAKIGSILIKFGAFVFEKMAFLCEAKCPIFKFFDHKANIKKNQLKICVILQLNLGLFQRNPLC